VDKTYGVPVVSHGGSMIGFKSQMIWLPEHGVGLVVLTNSDPGDVLMNALGRKLLEVLFDGKDEATARMSANAKSLFEQIAATRKLLTVPADPAVAASLASLYTNNALGEIAVNRKGDSVIFDFGE
jgi:hypothetical protein